MKRAHHLAVLLLANCGTSSSTYAFSIPVSVASSTALHTESVRYSSMIHSLRTGEMQDGIDLSSLSTVKTSGFLMTDALEEEAFTDSIDYFDGTIGVLLGGFGLVILVLGILKVLADRMDSAIEEVLVDFEGTMKQFFPQQWKEMSVPLEDLEGVDRQQKVMEIMEELQETDPTFMGKVNQKMGK